MATKREYKISNSTGLRKPVYTHLNEREITNVKGNIRKDVEAIDTNDGQPYDIEDQLADATNALNALMTIVEGLGGDTNDAAINKYKARQLEALNIKTTHTT